MTRSQLTSARDYFEEVLKPAKERFFSEEPSFSTLYPLINSLFHLHEWVWFYHGKKLKAADAALKGKGHYWANVVEKTVTDAGLIRDLNNVSKHVKLNITQSRNQGGPSRGAHYAANTVITMQTSLPGGSVYGGSLSPTTATVKEGNVAIDLDPIAKALFNFWQTTIDSLEPVPVTVNSTPNSNP